MHRSPAYSASTFETLHDLLDTFGALRERPLVIRYRAEGVETWTYGEVITAAERLAAGLMADGLAPGDAVALLADARAEWIVACLAALRAGAVVVPLDVQFRGETLERVLRDAAPCYLFTAAAQCERLPSGQAARVVLLDAPAGEPRGWRNLAAEPGRTWPPCSPDTIAALFYTSGTTGPPKGVPLTHRNLAFQLNTLVHTAIVGPEDRVLLPLPLHHVYPFVMGMLAPMAFGVPIILPRSLTGPQLTRALRDGKASVVIGVPRLYAALLSGVEANIRRRGRTAAWLFRHVLAAATWSRHRLKAPVGRALFGPLRRRIGPSLRLLACGGAALPTPLARRLQGLGWRVAEGYGLTETAPLLTLNLPDTFRPGTVGRPVPRVELRIDARKEGAGELLARGPGVFSGYRNLPEATAKAFTTDGWFRTGDLGWLDKSGYLHLAGRGSTLIVTEGGENVQPDTVESAYAEHPAIRELGVFGRNGRLLAVVVPDPGWVLRQHDGDFEIAVREAMQLQARDAPSYQRISEYVLSREPLARTRLGKLRRHLLEARFEQARQGLQVTGEPLPIDRMSDQDQALLEQPAARTVWEWMAQHYADRRLTPDSNPQLDLGVDSMEWLNLTMEIGARTGVELGDEAIGRVDSVRDLLREVAEASPTGGTAPSAIALEEPLRVLSEHQRRWLQPQGPLRTLASDALYGANRRIMRRYFRIQAEGLEHVPADGPFLLTPNHVSYLDPFVVAAALDATRQRHLFWAGWTGAAFQSPLTRFGSRLVRTVPIDPYRAIISSLAFGAAVLESGHALVWFPEGGRSPDGHLQPLKPGIGMLLEHFEVPVVPVVIVGSFDALPVGARWPRRRTVRVVFGEPVSARTLEEEGAGETRRARIVNGLAQRLLTLQGARGA